MDIRCLLGFYRCPRDYKVCSRFNFGNGCPNWISCPRFISCVRYPGGWSLKSPHEITLLMSKPPQLHMFRRRQSGAMVKKITLLKSYFPFKYLSKFVNTFCCCWNDPPLTFQFIIAVPLMRPQKMEMRPINMLRVKVRNRNSVCTLWVIFQYHQHSKQQRSVALQHKHLA